MEKPDLIHVSSVFDSSNVNDTKTKKPTTRNDIKTTNNIIETTTNDFKPSLNLCIKAESFRALEFSQLA